MGKLDGKVAFITGAGRGQGRSHAVRLAQEGADIIAVDLCAPIPSVGYDMSSEEDLRETVRQVEALDRRIVAKVADVRDSDGLEAALEDGVAALGRLDIVSANAGIATLMRFDDLTEDLWNDIFAVNLTGVYKTVKASIPHIKATGEGGSIILTASSAAVKGQPNNAHYVAAKHGVVGFMKVMAKELAPFMIRVNAVLPGAVNTSMIHNQRTYSFFMPDRDPTTITEAEVRAAFEGINVLPIPWVEPIDISHAVAFLASDEARYITGIQLPVDAGYTMK
jgi:SDR family mycofactocin-dependent oxidoreductase